MASPEELLRAVQLATRTLAGTGDMDTVLQRVLSICVEAVGASGGTIYLHDETKKALVFRYVLPEEVRDKLQFNNIPDDFGVAGEVFQTRQTIITEFEPRPSEQLSSIEERTGVHVSNMVTAPLVMQDEAPIGVVQLINKKDGTFTPSDVVVLDTVAAVSTMAYLNWKLTEEATRASTLLGMGKVSHDIGNLAASLYANISFSDFAISALKDQVRTNPTPESLEPAVGTINEMLFDLRLSVDRIVGYSRLISDLSAGRELRPDMRVAPLSETVRNSAAYLESEGRNNRIVLRYQIDENAPPTLHDELFVFRIVQNLVGNAIKAVRETVSDDVLDNPDAVAGEVEVRYRFDQNHIIEVKDSGPGMSAEVAERILSGNARSQWGKGGGSGWGTKIVLELAASHKGQVEIDSSPGAGTIFRVVIPHSGS